MKDQPVQRITTPMILLFALCGCVSEPSLRSAVGPATTVLDPELPRGIIECETDRPCGTPARSDSQSDLAPAPVSANDIAFHFFEVDMDGQRRRLSTGGTLAPGKKLVIRIEARRDAYVYLWHSDHQRRSTELLGASKAVGSDVCSRSNRVWAGQVIELPVSAAYPSLDRMIGTERIQPLVSLRPVCSRGDLQAGWSHTGIEADCSDVDSYCGKVFVIHRTTSA